MKISKSELDRFRSIPRDPALRLGQAWYNHFDLHRHTPASEEERLLLDSIYNEQNNERAYRLIIHNFTDWNN